MSEEYITTPWRKEVNANLSLMDLSIYCHSMCPAEHEFFCRHCMVRFILITNQKEAAKRREKV